MDWFCTKEAFAEVEQIFLIYSWLGSAMLHSFSGWFNHTLDGNFFPQLWCCVSGEGSEGHTSSETAEVRFCCLYLSYSHFSFFLEQSTEQLGWSAWCSAWWPPWRTLGTSWWSPSSSSSCLPSLESSCSREGLDGAQIQACRWSWASPWCFQAHNYVVQFCFIILLFLLITFLQSKKLCQGMFLLDNNTTDVEPSWQSNSFNFDNVAEAMLTLFVTSTFEGWPG